MTSQAIAIAPADIDSSAARTEVELKQVLAQFLGCTPEEIPSQVTFLDMGVDSLGLLTAAQAIREKMGVRIPFRMLLDEYPTITAVAGYIDQQRPAPKPDDTILAPLEITVPAEAVEVGKTKMELVRDEVGEALDSIAPVSEALPVNGHNASVEEILARQIDLMRMQLELLSPGKGAQVQPPAQVRIPAATNGKVETKSPIISSPAASQSSRLPEKTPAPGTESDFVAHEALNLPTGELDPQQQRHLADLIARLSKRTAKSKALTQKYRKVLADNRVSAGFRKTWKELIYQILVERAEGCKIWDVDGNEYIDITMGYGAIIFGHSPDFLMGPLAKQVEAGIGLGPQSHLAGEVAELLCKLTGCERAAFCNSGTEAVMSALRLARTFTGRSRIAMFTGSYHGTFDGVMVRGQKGPDGELKALPLAPGIPQSMIQDVLLLRYANPASLETLKKHVSDLAAVLVAPVPSRDPEGYNQQFLVKLREITEQAGTALIFDEVVTGFRVHPGGAQALFNVRADLVTYGKAVGGGLPIGVVAGKASYMDGIDGGDWSFGDNSYPKAETTFFAGTFFKHPWVMTSTLAILREIERRGQELYDSLANTTRNFAAKMNTFFRENDLPFELVAYGSFFMINPQKEVKHSDLFYYHLLERGVYIWEGHSCFFSTAHTTEDVEKVARAIRESALEMRKGGFVRPARGGPSPEDSKAGGQAQSSNSPKDETQIKPQAPRKLRLTEEQRNLLAHSQTGDESSRAYNEVLCLHLRGKLSLDALRKSVQQLVDRHHALRITIDPDGESANIHEHVPIILRVEYIQQGPAEEQGASLSGWVQRQMRETFDLQQGPLVRTGLARLNEQHHVLTLVMHHIAVDGWSFGILLNELGALYSAHVEGRSPALPPPAALVPPVESGPQQNDSAEMEESEAFWKQTFAGGVPVLQLPTDHPRPPVLSFRGAGVRSVLDNTMHDGAAAAARKCGATLFATLLSTYALLLHRLAGQEEIVIGVPMAGQASSNRNAVGYNVRMAPVRSTLDPSAKFSELVAQTGRTLMDSLEHARVPLSRLVKVLNIRRNPNRLPLMPVAFNMDKAAPPRSWAGLEYELVTPESDIAKFDLEISVEESAGQLRAQLQYSTDLFEPTGAQMILMQWRQVLKGIIANPECRISELNLLTEAQRDQILVQWNNTQVEYPRRCVHELFEEQVAKTPSAVAVCYQAQKLTYAELDQRANQLARYLQKMDVKPEMRVGICVGRSLEMMVGLLGIMKSGGAYVPLDPSYPPERLAFMVADAEVGIVLTQERLLSKLAAGTGQRPPVAVCLDTQWEKIAGEPGTRPVSHVNPDNLAYIYYTSGSTGRPKGVAIAHYAIANYFCWGLDGYGAAEGQGAAVHSSIAVDLTLTNFLPLFAGGRVMLAEETPGVDGLVKLLRDEPKFSLLKITPTHLTLLNPQLTAREKSGSTRRLVIGADNLVAEPTLPWRDEAPEVELLNEYGPTETVVGCSIYRIDAASARSGGVPIGKPIANITMYVLDAGGQPVPVGMPGELYIGGIGVARGYWKRPDLTAEKFVPDEFAGGEGARFYRTGDRARFLPDGNLEFLGRLDHQVKIRGYRIEPGEVEAVLSGCPGVQKAMVVVRRDTPGDKRLVAYVAAPGNTVRESELRQYLRERLPDYMVPTAFVIMESLPVGPTGKIDPKDLPKPEMEGDEENYVEPRSDAERVLARIWAQVLGVERVGVNDNFFELGGDSILALQISSRAIAEGIKVTNQIMFQYQSVAEVVAAVQEREPAAAASIESKSWPLTPIQSWFFERDIPDRNHWNQSVMLQTPANMDTKSLSRSLAAVVQQHAALGVRFSRTANGIAMVPGMPESRDLLEVVDLSGVPKEELAATLTAHANRIQRSLNLQAGPLCRFAYFSTGENSPGRFFAVIHHLVVDVVSWRILLRDLETACSQVVAGKDPELMAPSTTYPEWARRLKEYAGGPEISGEFSFWLKEERYLTKPLPVDSPVTVTRRSSQRLLEESLDREQTEILLRGAPRKLRSPISEVLLAGLAITLARWTENPWSLVDIEGHGREELFPDVDLTRTVGWFTTIFPVLLHGQPEDFKATLEAVRREFRGVPQGGIGYGILRHLHPDASVRERLRQVPSSEICFNYLGQFDTVLEKSGPFQSAGESGGDSQPPEAPQSHLLSLDVSIMGGRLRHVWMYNTEAHREETIRRVASWFSQALRDAIAACQL